MVTGNNESRLESWCVTRKHPNSNLSRMANSLCVENAIVRARTHTHTHTHICPRCIGDTYLVDSTKTNTHFRAVSFSIDPCKAIPILFSACVSKVCQAINCRWISRV